VAFLVFAAVVAGTPGPSNALLTATGAQVGFVRGLPAVFGVAAGMAVLMFLVCFGLAAVLVEVPLVFTALRWLGAAVLLWLAWRIATSRPSDTTRQQPTVGFVGAAAFQWVNPKSWLACASAAATYVDAGSGSALPQAAALAGLFAAVALPCLLVWLAFGAAVQRALRSPRALRIFNLAMAGLLAASVLLIVA
jgi:threonine/homoserine/homoserine lactone efflux protein